VPISDPEQTQAQPFLTVLLELSPGDTAGAGWPTVLDSVAGEPAGTWEVLVIGTQEAIADAGLTGAAGGHPGMHTVVVPPELSRASRLNLGLERSTGIATVLVRPGDALATGAVGALRDEWLADVRTDVLYSDERLELPGRPVEVLTKPDFSPERLRGQEYTGRGVAYRTEFLRQLAGFSEGFELAEEYELVLRCFAAANHVGHIRRPLYVTRDGGRFSPASSATVLSAQRAVVADLERAGVAGTVTSNTGSQTHRVDYAVTGSPLVSIVIPTRGGSARIRGRERCLVLEAVREIVTRSSYSNIEIVVVADEATPRKVVADLIDVHPEKVRIVDWEKPFNFSEKMNRGVAHSRGEFVLLLNDDVELITPDWIETMLGLAQQPGVGMVGTLLYFEGGAVQHGGHTYVQGAAGHIGFGWSDDNPGPGNAMLVAREVAGATAACSLMSRETFFEVGGFSSLLPGNYNDVDLCMKVTGAGHRIIWTPHARLFHFESQSREPSVATHELETLHGRWLSRLQVDPYWPHSPY